MKTFIYIRAGRCYTKVQIKDILFLKASDKYVKMFTKQKTYLILDTITRMQEQLSDNHFLRVHRSYLISILHISQYHLHYVIISGIKIPIAESCRKEIWTLLSLPTNNLSDKFP